MSSQSGLGAGGAPSSSVVVVGAASTANGGGDQRGDGSGGQEETKPALQTHSQGHYSQYFVDDEDDDDDDDEHYINEDELEFAVPSKEVAYNAIPTFPVRPSFKNFQNALRPASQVVVFDGCPNDPHHPSSTPIYQTSTFVQPSSAKFGSCGLFGVGWGCLG